MGAHDAVHDKFAVYVLCIGADPTWRHLGRLYEDVSPCFTIYFFKLLVSNSLLLTCSQAFDAGSV